VAFATNKISGKCSVTEQITTGDSRHITSGIFLVFSVLNSEFQQCFQRALLNV
jgi:hypothetical protein